MKTWKLAVASALLLIPILPCSAAVSARKVATGAYPELTVDRIGDAHLVYVRDGLLRYQRRDAAVGAWGREENTNLPARGVERSDPEVAVDSHGRPHVLVGSAYAWRDGDHWRPIDPDVKRDTALAIDSRDNVYVVRRGGHHGGHVGLRVRAAGTDQFVLLPDPDIADGLPLGRNDHVYAHLAINPRDDSLHIVYRHGAPQKCAYRVSRDGGRTWSGGGICDDDREAPSVAIGTQSRVIVVTGTGQLFEQGEPGAWKSYGRALAAGSRELPAIAIDAAGRVIMGSFGGRFNMGEQGRFGDEQLLPAPRGKKLGFVALAVARQSNTAYVAWEEGDAVNNDELAGESDILFAEIELADNQSETGQTAAIRFPSAGAGQSGWQRQTPAEVGLDPAVIAALDGTADRWALWRHGYLIHVHGDFNHKQDVASLRKTWHALTVGAALGQGKIKSLDEPISRWETDLTGEDAKATWRHVITQSSAFDYPYGDWPDYAPGRMWTYSDKNPVRLCGALAKLYGRKDYHDNYDAVLKAAFFDAIGLAGWSTGFTRKDDGVRLHLNLDHMGRLGLLVLARGQWNGRQVIPRTFVEQLEAKQTYGMLANYHGPDDGDIGLLPEKFRECPYGYMTWVNSDGDYYPGADRGWAWGSGAGGNVILWNYRFGIVYAAQGMKRPPAPVARGVPQMIEQHFTARASREAVDLHGRFEKAFANDKRYADPYRDVTLNVALRRPDGQKISWWGFHDGDGTWRFRYSPDQVGVWSYEVSFSDRQPTASGSFECLRGDQAAGIGIYRQNPVWFGDRAGRPLLVRGLHIGDRFFAANWSDDQRRGFLDWAQANKYNLLSIASHFLNRDAPGRGQGWQTPKLWPLDAAEYRRMESILDDLARRGIAVFPFAGFFGQKSNYPRDAAEQERYVRYTLARLAPYGNMLWNVAGPEPNLRESWMAAEDVERLGRLIKRLDPLAHPISVHNRTGDDPYRDSDWTTYGVLQGPKSLDRAILSRGLLESHHPAKPLLAQETLWSGNVNHIRRFGGKDYSDDELRKNAFVIHMSAAAFVFADNDGDSSTGFSGTLALADSRQKRHDIIRGVWDCLEVLGTHRMKPRQDLVSRGSCLAEPGEAYLVYLENPQSVDVKLDGGRYRATWISAKTPAERKDQGVIMDGTALLPPLGGDDWLLRLTRERE